MANASVSAKKAQSKERNVLVCDLMVPFSAFVCTLVLLVLLLLPMVFLSVPLSDIYCSDSSLLLFHKQSNKTLVHLLHLFIRSLSLTLVVSDSTKLTTCQTLSHIITSLLYSEPFTRVNQRNQRIINPQQPTTNNQHPHVT